MKKKTNRTGEKFSIKNQKDLNDVRWKVVECDTKNCWCACIYTEVDVKDEEGSKRMIVGSGCITKDNAEYIVNMQNEYLELKEEEKETKKFVEYMKSGKFKKEFHDSVKSQTWAKGYPMIYLNNRGQIVRHWKNGLIEIVKDNKKSK